MSQQQSLQNSANNQTNTKQSKIFVIGICGGDCSGKRLIHSVIKQYFAEKKISIASVPQESFLIKESDNIYEPNAYDWRKMLESINSLKSGKSIQIHPFDKIKEEVEQQAITIEPSQIIVVHGLHILANQQLKKCLSLSCYVDSDDDIRLSRRVYQDTKSRGKTITECIHNYLQNIKPAYERYTQPLKKVADLLVPKFGGDYIAKSQANIQNAGFQNAPNKAVKFLLEAILQVTGIKGKVGVQVNGMITRSTSIDSKKNIQ